MKLILRIAIFITLIEYMASEIKRYDLSYSYDNTTLLWPGGEKFHYTAERRGTDDDWFAANDYATAEHCGTHLDAPYHFCKTGKTVGKLPLKNFFVKGVIVDASRETANNWEYALSPSVFEEWEKKNGPIPEKSVVLVSFGWGHRYPNKTEYLGPSDTDLRFPGFSIEAATWLANTGKVVGVGLDTPSIDVSKDDNFPVHKLLLCSHGMYILENVALAHKNLPPVVDLVVLPMKLKDGTGAPVRIVATVNERNSNPFCPISGMNREICRGCCFGTTDNRRLIRRKRTFN